MLAGGALGLVLIESWLAGRACCGGLADLAPSNLAGSARFSGGNQVVIACARQTLRGRLGAADEAVLGRAILAGVSLRLEVHCGRASHHDFVALVQCGVVEFI